MVLLSFVLVALLDLSVRLNPQALVLYLSICLCLLLGGAGRFSLDYLLAELGESKSDSDADPRKVMPRPPTPDT